MPKVNVGVVGVGYLGTFHAKTYSELKKNVNLVAVCDIDKKSAKRIAKRLRVWYFPDYHTMFDKVDAVSIVVPTSLHYKIAKDFLNNGIHVLIEKPIAQKVEEAEELVDIARKKGLTLQVGHIERFNPVVRAVEPLIKEPRFIEGHRAGPYTTKSRVKDVGVVLDLMIHDIDIILSLVKSEVKKIEAVGISTISPFEDTANVRLTFNNGAIADIIASRVTQDEIRKIVISQEDAYITLNFLHQDAHIVKKKNGKIIKKKLKTVKRKPLKAELKSFISCIQNSTRPIVSGEEGTMALRVAMDILKKIDASKSKE